MAKYLIIDTANMFFRARHVTSRYADSWEKIGYALHITFSSISKVHRTFGADHVVFALEGRSWRKDFYEPYKKNRAVARAALTDAEAEEDALFWETYDSFCTFLTEQSNVSTIQHKQAEADDVIARWINMHPNDDHTIISSDSDFYQLIAPNVQQYNGISDTLITLEGMFNDKGKPIIDKKTNEPKEAPIPEWLLFEKCMRGDTSDNVFSAYPGVRKKGSKNKIGLLEAFADKNDKGYNWNNLMLQRWTDHNGLEHRVLDDYRRNVHIIDLTAQPDDIKEKVDTAIKEQVNCTDKGQVGVRFLKFCGKYDLNKLSEYPDNCVKWLNPTYKGEITNA